MKKRNLITSSLLCAGVLSGCASNLHELESSDITQFVRSCSPTEEEQRLIRQNVIKMGMQSCVVIQIMGNPERMSVGEENGLMTGNMLYQFKSGDYKERVLIRLSMDKVLVIDVVKLKLFGSSFFSPTLYSYDPNRQIPYK